MNKNQAEKRMNRLESRGLCPYCEKVDHKTTSVKKACCVDAARAERIGTGMAPIKEPGRQTIKVVEALMS